MTENHMRFGINSLIRQIWYTHCGVRPQSLTRDNMNRRWCRKRCWSLVSEVKVFAADVEDDGAWGLLCLLWCPIDSPCLIFLSLSPHGEASWINNSFTVSDDVAILAKVVGDAIIALADKRWAGWKGISSRETEEKEWKERDERHCCSPISFYELVQREKVGVDFRGDKQVTAAATQWNDFLESNLNASWQY